VQRLDVGQGALQGGQAVALLSNQIAGGDEKSVSWLGDSELSDTGPNTNGFMWNKQNPTANKQEQKR